MSSPRFDRRLNPLRFHLDLLRVGSLVDPSEEPSTLQRGPRPRMQVVDAPLKSLRHVLIAKDLPDGLVSDLAGGLVIGLVRGVLGSRPHKTEFASGEPTGHERGLGPRFEKVPTTESVLNLQHDVDFILRQGFKWQSGGGGSQRSRTLNSTAVSQRRSGNRDCDTLIEATQCASGSEEGRRPGPWKEILRMWCRQRRACSR